jgi:eukaryotic-like serine/threonine-protein kinase
MSQDKRGALPEPSEIAGRYQVIKKLGAGAFGTVYKAKDKILGRMLAIKTIRLEGLAAAGASLDEMLDRFKREAQVSAQLKHPNIVTIYDIGDSDGMSYLAMEFIDGEGLERVIAQGKLGLERAASIGAQVADALDFAHQHSVVHRDIKPANIMLESGDRVKVTDFGIAKVTDSAEHLTMTGSLLGTPSYMSPEQARGGVIDGRSDLFAVGCVLYEMMAGKKAFRGESITALIFKIITEEPQPIQELDPEIPDAMVRIIAKALAKAPDSRYQSGRELADELIALTRAGSMPTVRQVETPTVPGSAMPSVTPTVQVAAPTMAAPATVAGTAPTKLMSPVPPPLPKPTPPPRPPAGSPPPPRAASPQPAAAVPAARKSGGGAGLIIGLGLVGLLGAVLLAGAGWYFFLRKPATQIADVTPTPAPTVPSDVSTPIPPPTSSPVVTATPSTAPATPPPVVAQTPVPTAPPTTTPVGPGRQLPTPAPRPPVVDNGGQEPTAGRGSFLDAEPEDGVDGRAAGEDLAGKYRSGQGAGGSTGSTARFRPRERSPRGLIPVERPAVATIRHIINAQEAYHRKRNRYGSLSDMATAQSLFLDVPFQPTTFRRGGYHFELTVEPDGFRVVGMPTSPNGRPFIGDDTGIIRVGTE